MAINKHTAKETHSTHLAVLVNDSTSSRVTGLPGSNAVFTIELLSLESIWRSSSYSRRMCIRFRFFSTMRSLSAAAAAAASCSPVEMGSVSATDSSGGILRFSSSYGRRPP